MNDDFKYCREQLYSLELEECQRFAIDLLKMLEALSQSVDECASSKVSDMIVDRFHGLIRGKD